MSGKEREYVDVTKQAEGAYVDATKSSKPMSKAEEAQAESSRAFDAEGAPPPSYGEHGEPANAPPAHAAPPYKSLEEDVSADMRALLEGDPNEKISVPMIHSTEKKSLKNMFLREVGKVSQTVIVRKMPRHYYIEHYAKDSEGNYIGTGKPAADAGLVFVPSKGTSEDLLQQVRKVAFGKQHYTSDFGGPWGASAGAGGAWM